MDGVELEFTEDALEAIADQAILRGTGARGLRAIMEEVLLPVMYDIPSRDDVAKVVVTKETVQDNVLPTIVPRKPARPERRDKSALAARQLAAKTTSARHRGALRADCADYYVLAACRRKIPHSHARPPSQSRETRVKSLDRTQAGTLASAGNPVGTLAISASDSPRNRCP